MTFCVDIDDTILFSDFNNGEYILKDINKPLIKKINKLYREGNEIIIFTGRHWNCLKLTKEQLKKSGVKYTTLIMGRPVADYYIDDKSILPDDFLKGD